jgi:hypothetical protein
LNNGDGVVNDPATRQWKDSMQEYPFDLLKQHVDGDLDGDSISCHLLATGASIFSRPPLAVPIRKTPRM